MVKFIGKQISKKIKKKANILFLGITFKEDVPDLRNSKSLELIKFLKKQKHKVIIYDPFIEKLKDFQNLDLSKKKKLYLIL